MISGPIKKTMGPVHDFLGAPSISHKQEFNLQNQLTTGEGWGCNSKIFAVEDWPPCLWFTNYWGSFSILYLSLERQKISLLSIHVTHNRASPQKFLYTILWGPLAIMWGPHFVWEPRYSCTGCTFHNPVVS